jgi:hypothetical protein
MLCALPLKERSEGVHAGGIAATLLHEAAKTQNCKAVSINITKQTH